MEPADFFSPFWPKIEFQIDNSRDQIQQLPYDFLPHISELPGGKNGNTSLAARLSATN